MSQTPTQVLDTAISLLRRGHCKGWYAVSKTGHPTDVKSERAVAWCVRGALMAATEGDPVSSEAHERAMSAIKVTLEGWHIAWYNDRPDTTQADVIDLLERAKERV